jgi:photosystem II stability/assembly factor-like uncharacterized protein
MKRTFLILLGIALMALFAMLNNSTTQQSAAMPACEAMTAPKESIGKGSWQRVWRSEGALYDFLALDDNTILGVGADGMIVGSTDGGVYWHYEAPAAGYDLRTLDVAANTIWAAGEQGVILRSGDRGKTWEQIDAGTAEEVNDILVQGNASIWIVGDNGLMMASRDGGASWTPIDSGVTTPINAIGMFADGAHGVAVGENGVILVTTDGGNAWQQKSGVAPASDHLRDIHIFENKVWAVGSGGRVYFSSNQGDAWQVQTSLGFPMTRVKMAPGQDQIGWLIGLDGRIARTSNGGATWRSLGNDDGYHLHALGLSGLDRVWVGGSVMTESLGNWGKPPDKPSWFVWASTDGGSKWHAPITGLYPWFYNVTAVTKEDAYVTGQDMQIMKTRDGGYSWREIHSEIANNPDIFPAGVDVRGKILHAIACAPGNAEDCHAAGREEVMLHTTDGGNTWTREAVPGWGKSIYDIAMTSDVSGVAISRNYNYYTDDGVHWSGAFDNGAGRTHMDLDMVNAWQGAVSTKKNLFDYTTDAGRHWKGYFISNYFFYNSGVDAMDVDDDGELDHAWLVGCTVQSSVEGPCLQALILFNPDAINDPGGWRALLQDENVARLQKIEMVNEETGWVVGYDGEVLFTEDRGVTWKKQASKTDANLYGLDVYDRNLAYAVGQKGDIIRYSEPDRRIGANPQWINQIDGHLDEWNSLNARRINSGDVDAIIGETPAPEDLAAYVRVRWDDQGLYLGVEVTDATLTTSGAVTDALGIALDGLGDGVSGDDDHVLQFYADGSAVLDGAPMATDAFDIIAHADGYAIEAFIPQATLGGDFEHLRKLGVNVGLYDAAPDGDAYTSQMFWTGSGLNSDPAAFGTLTLYQHDRNLPVLEGLPAGEITVDGNLNEWTDENSYPLSSSSADSIQGEIPANDADLSATFRMRWWKDYLFLGVNVSDDVVGEGDSVQIAFDSDEDNRPSPHDTDLRIWPDGRIAVNGVQGGAALAAGKTAPDGYQLEVAIPASMISGTLDSRQKLHLNFGLIDFDDDETTFETAMNWQGASVAGVQADFGWLELAPNSLLIKMEHNDARFQDAFITEWNPTQNTYNWETMNIRPGDIESPLVKFDITDAIPDNADVSLSYLGIYTAESRFAMSARIYRLLRDWIDYQATWQQAQNGIPWETPGAKGSNDQAQTPSDEQQLALSSDDGSCGDRNATWFDVTADINAFLDGSAENYGWVLRGDAGSNINFKLATTQHRNPDCRPEMYFEYTLPSGVLPTPTPVATPAGKTIYLPIITP